MQFPRGAQEGRAKTMVVCGVEYPIIDYVVSEIVPRPVPLLDIPMMSDERWNELAEQNAVHNYTKEYGRPPETVQEAVKWQRERVDALVAQIEAAPLGH